MVHKFPLAPANKICSKATVQAQGKEMSKQGVEIERKRILYAAGIFFVILLGLASRSESTFLPKLIKEYAGDTLWALVAYLSVGFLFPRLAIWKVALIAGLFSLAVELSQLYQADWINRIRRLRLGGLVLGYGFLWSDLVCYLAGIAIGILVELTIAVYLFNGRRSRIS